MAKDDEEIDTYSVLHNDMKANINTDHLDDDRDTQSHSASDEHDGHHKEKHGHSVPKATTESMDFEAVESIMWRKVSLL